MLNTRLIKYLILSLGDVDSLINRKSPYVSPTISVILRHLLQGRNLPFLGGWGTLTGETSVVPGSYNSSYWGVKYQFFLSTGPSELSTGL